jgi:hypothetical protein
MPSVGLGAFRRIDNLLRLMRYLSHAAAAKAPDSPYITSGENDHAGPTNPGSSLFERWTAEDSELTLVVTKMERDLRRATHSPRSIERREDRDKRILEQYAGWPAAKVALWEDLSAQSIRDIRRKAGVDQHGLQGPAARPLPAQGQLAV